MAKFLYLPIEIGSRELAAKTLIAAVAAERGFHVFLGLQNKLFRNAGNLPPGIYLSKGTNEFFVVHVPTIWESGHAFAAAEEESFGFCLERSPLNFNSESLRDRCDLYLCVGNDEADYMERRFGSAFPKALTGNARVDLLRPQLRPLYERDRAEIFAREGRFILFNMNFGLTNAFDRSSVEKQYQLWKTAGVFRPGQSEADQRREFAEFVEWEHANMRTMEGLLSSIASLGLPAIVRPHPSELAETWVAFVRTLNAPNIKVVMGTPHIPYMLAADLVVHPGCTTGMEALMLDVPALSLTPGDSAAHDYSVANKVNVTAKTVEEAAAIIDRHWHGSSELRRALPALKEHLEKYVADVASEKLTAERIVEALLPIAAERDIPEDALSMDISWLHPPPSSFQLAKFAVTEEAIRTTLTGYRTCLDRFRRVQVSTVCENIFLVTADAVSP